MVCPEETEAVAGKHGIEPPLSLDQRMREAGVVDLGERLGVDIPDYAGSLRLGEADRRAGRQPAVART